MADIHIPNITPEAINEAIEISQPGDTLVFDAGSYTFTKTLHIQNDRSYWIVGQRLDVSNDFQGDYLIEVHTPAEKGYVTGCIIDTKGKGFVNFVGSGFYGVLADNISH